MDNMGNITEILREGPKSERGRIARIQVVVCLTAVFMAFLVVFGSSRRRFHNGLLRFSIWASYTVSGTLVTYAIGLMQSAPFRDEFFVVWAIFLLISLGGADCITAYSLEDNEQWKRYNWQIGFQFVWLGWLLVAYHNDRHFGWAIWVLYFLTGLKLNGRSLAHLAASKSFGLARSTHLTADFMAKQDRRVEEGMSMSGYDYLVRGEQDKFVQAITPSCMKRLTSDNQDITMQQIWECESRLLNPADGDRDIKVVLKDICLSFALFKLLCTRFAGYSMSENTHVQTWNVIKGKILSPETDGHKRAFKVIEVELAFLFDFFYTKYPLIFRRGQLLFKIAELYIVISGCLTTEVILSHMHQSRLEIHIFVSRLVMITLIVTEALQLLYVIFSDWTKIFLVCKYVEKSSNRNTLWKQYWMEKLILFICSRQCFKSWDGGIGQYCLLDSFDCNPSKLLYNYFTVSYIDCPRNGQEQSPRVKLPEKVKEAVILTLQRPAFHLANGKASFQLNMGEQLFHHFDWAFQLPTHTHAILVWHIATALCEIEPTHQTNEFENDEYFIVATKLSKYCAYLVTFAPRLLPDHSYVAELIFDQVVSETRVLLKNCKRDKQKIFQKMNEVNEDNSAETIIKMGAKLGKLLIGKIQSENRRWEVLAEFWVEMMLFLAPSDDTTAHAEHLAQGGEFITHLWALLSHAGILKRDSNGQDTAN